MKKILFGAAALCMLLAACKKDDDGGSSSKSRRDYLTTGKWRMTQELIVINLLGTMDTSDEYAALQNCEKDNLTIFGTDNIARTDEGPTKCNSADSQVVVEGPWALTSNDAKFSFMGYNTTIDQLDGSTFRVHYDSTSAFYSAKLTVAFTHVD